MKRGEGIMLLWMLRAGVTLLAGTLLGALCGCGHNPNHDINIEQARAAANRVHPPPAQGVKIVPGAGG